MLDQSLLQSHFIGRDGFRWWIGQVAPYKCDNKQLNGEGGWGNRVQVRIMGYHPFDANELKDEDLPWAQVLLPTTAGSGAANYANNPKLQQGDTVVGFFLDGDNAQIPIIIGAMGRTSKVSTAQYTSPFVPFTGYTDTIKPPNGTLSNDQTNESNVGSQPDPLQVSPENIQNSGGGEDDVSAFSGIGKEVVFADTCEETSAKTIKSEVSNFLKDIQDVRNKISDLQSKIHSVASVIKSSVQWIVGKLFDLLYKFLIKLIQKGLDLLYKTVFASVLAATGNPGIAQQAGVASNAAFVIPVQILEKAISCVAAAIINGLQSVIEQLLTSLIENAKRFVTCAVEQFLGSLLNTVIDSIENGLSSALGGVSSLLSAGFSIASFLRDPAGTLLGAGGLDCNQDNEKCSGKVKEWVIGKGPKNTMNVADVFSNIQGFASSVVGDVTSAVDQFKQSAQSFGNLKNVKAGGGSLSNCYAGFPTFCGPPIIDVFGGGGSGCEALAIIGNVVSKTGLVNNTERTGSIISIKVLNGGSGYTFPPFVEITDECGLGRGAVARSVIKNGKVIAIYLVSKGDQYPVGNQQDYGVKEVLVQSPGYNYSDDDYGLDNLGNRYRLNVENGFISSARPLNKFKVEDDLIISIQSKTGKGAILKPILDLLSEIPDGTPVKQIDCVT